MLIVGRLEHQSFEKTLATPEAQRIMRLPGFFRKYAGSEQTPKQKQETLWASWNKTVMPVIQAHSPVLYHLLRIPYKQLQAQYHRLSQTPEITGPSED
jgi:hypothetical protein